MPTSDHPRKLFDKSKLKEKGRKILRQSIQQEYRQRHVATLKPVKYWDETDISAHKKHNRLLQPDYSSLDADTIIELAKVTGEDWLTDFVCPNASNALKLNIAADLVTKYKVPVDSLDKYVQIIFNMIILENPSFIRDIEDKISMQLEQKQDELHSKAQEHMRNKYPNITPESQNYGYLIEKFILLESEKEKKAITHHILKRELPAIYPAIVSELGIEEKPAFNHNDNVDYSILGAAGSGKSSISRELVQGDKLDYVVLATDDYRGVSFDSNHEQIETDQVFIRTQDTAYSIKELVQDRLMSSVYYRPNIILDCVSLEGWHRQLLQGNQQTISAVACLNDASLVPARAYNRALDPQSGPADRNRQVNTSSLLKGHASASSLLLSSIPQGVKTDLYDTNIPRGEKPPILAAVDTTTKNAEIKIFNLTKFASFVAKSNLNHEAEKKNDLYYHQDKEYAYTYDSQYKAAELLKLLSPNSRNKNDHYELTLCSNEDKQPYAKISMQGNKINLVVLDENLLNKTLQGSSLQGEGWLLKSMIMQIHFGSLEAVRQEIKEHGREATFEKAKEHLLTNTPVQEMQQTRRNSNGVVFSSEMTKPPITGIKRDREQVATEEDKENRDNNRSRQKR